MKHKYILTSTQVWPCTSYSAGVPLPSLGSPRRTLGAPPYSAFGKAPSIFKDNLKKINERNKKSKTAVFGINRFTDLTTEEVLQMYTGYRLNDPYECPPAHDSPDMTPPESLDWRDKNKVTRVKDQGNCGSCWAFSAVGNLEGQYAIKHNELQEFSEQQLVDCDKYDFGCGGGLMDHAFIWLQKNGGIELEKDYPYEGKDNKCNFDNSKAFATVSNCVRFNVTNNEEMLKQYLATTGPLSIAVDAMPMAAYTGGILDDCASNDLNHGVLLVGYGTENGEPYWLIKNSHGTTFGDNGYIKIRRGINLCNIMGSEIITTVLKMFPLVVLLCCLGALVSSAPQKVFYSVNEAPSYFEDFMQTYNKVYSSEAEKQTRFEIFKKNLEMINEQNQIDDAVFGINEFTDLTTEEFISHYTGYGNVGEEIRCQLVNNASRVSAPESHDWRALNKVTPSKPQSSCGSCWAFSAVGAVESQYAMVHSQLVDLSEQQVDLANTGGIMGEQDYSYQNAQGPCRYDASRAVVKVTGCRQFRLQSEEELKEILASVGPISIAVSIDGTWQKYRGGIKKVCPQGPLNHAVLLVGYGSEGGRPFWIIKNSWGTGWGESGFIRIKRNVNACNLMGGQFVTATVQ
ncbi:thiol protease aleurain-like [Ostrinia furnacalis]|uniref:thiol protease aleurain-like n=1 Tax=Ostrinia furnacalis TaxID=93504 RepID=UPI00103A00AA|nr:thiol protease aleurain-like [Ostrinia furnacalis]